MAEHTITTADAEESALAWIVAETNRQRLERDPAAELSTVESYLAADVHALLGGYVTKVAADAQAAFAARVREEAAPVFDAVIQGYISQADPAKRAQFAADVAKSAEANLGVTIAQ